MAAICIGGSAPLSGPEGPPPSIEALAIEERLAPGGRFEKTLGFGSRLYVELEAEQLEGDVVLILLDPSGEEIGRSDLPGKPSLKERLAVVTSQAGNYTVRLQAGGDVESGARFNLRVVAEERARRESARRAEGVRSFQDGLSLIEEQEESSFRAAIEHLRGAERLFGEAGDSPWQGRALLELGGTHRRIGEVDLAREALARAVELLRESPDRHSLVRALYSYGGFLSGVGEPVQGLEYCEEALELVRRLGEPDLEASVLNSLAVLHYRQGEIERGAGFLEQAVALRRRSGERENLAANLSNLGVFYRVLGRTEDALRANQEALRISEELDDVESEVQILNNLGVLHTARGENQAALDAYARTRELAERLGDVESMATAGFNEGSLYKQLGEPERARSRLLEALALSRQIESPAEGNILRALGGLAAEAGDHDEGLRYLEQARLRAVAVEDPSIEGYTWFDIGRCLLDMGDLEGAREAFEAARALQAAAPNQPALSRTLRYLSIVAVALGELETGRSAVEEAFGISQQIGDPSESAAAREQMAAVLEASGDLEAAKEELESAIETLETLRADLIDPDRRATFFARSHERYVKLVGLLERLDPGLRRAGSAAEAFEVSERARARSLVERLAESRDRLGHAAAPQLERARRELVARLSASQTDLRELLRRPGIEPAAVEAGRSEVLETLRSLQALDEEIRRADPRWSTLAYPEPLTADAARSLLDSDTALLSYFLGADESYLFVVTSRSVRALAIPGEAELLPVLQEVRKLTEEPSRRSIGRLTLLSRRLYALLVEPAEEVIGGYRNLVIVPDGALHYLPFEALRRSGAGAGGDYLITRWGVSYVPSVSVLASLLERRSSFEARDSSWVAFADPAFRGAMAPGVAPTARGVADRESWQWRRLAGAREEVESIAGLFAPGEVSIFTGDAASEQRFKSDGIVRRARYLHLASHALVDNRTPDLSAVLLAPDDGDVEDGLLQTYEILDLSLSAELVVLSGCETALGREVRGEGLVGLTQAFLFAGADAVSVSLWPVEDGSTSSLMLAFYRELSAGRSAVQALRQAKLDRLADPVTAHPFHWAPFVLVGATG